ncbi:MAG TPA: YafY family protein [Actinospica sp.]|jgi:predicted DNA-binding transcriptional regulator YafY|nr:YafY family protein [Actinospica sp.]
MNRPTSRVLQLLELLQSGGTRTVAELADRLGVDGRTVRRYVDHLIDLDVPVESVRGRYGGYRLAPGYRLPPLMLGDDEALAVLLGLIAGRRTGLTTALSTAGETAAAKIRRVLPKPLACRLETVLDSIAFTHEPDDDGFATPDATVLLTVADAVRHRRPISITYTDRDAVRSNRVVHPYGIVSHENRWYVRGMDPAIGEERTFRMDRIEGVRTLPGEFDAPEAPEQQDQARSVLTGFATAAYRYEVTVWINGTVEQIRARLPASVAVLDPVSEKEAAEQWVRAEMRAESLDWLPAVLASLDRPFEIERPNELRELTIAFAERIRSSARAVVPADRRHR